MTTYSVFVLNTSNIKHQTMQVVEVNFKMTKYGLYGFFINENIEYKFSCDMSAISECSEKGKNKDSNLVLKDVGYVVRSHSCDYVPILSKRKSCTVILTDIKSLIRGGHKEDINYHQELPKDNMGSGILYGYAVGFLAYFLFFFAFIEILEGLYRWFKH